MKVPNFINDPFVEADKEGKFRLTAPWQTVLSTLITQMQIHLSDEGFKLPEQPTVNINKFATQAKRGTLLIDKNTNELKVNINGVIKTVTVT